MPVFGLSPPPPPAGPPPPLGSPPPMLSGAILPPDHAPPPPTSYFPTSRHQDIDEDEESTPAPPTPSKKPPPPKVPPKPSHDDLTQLNRSTNHPPPSGSLSVSPHGSSNNLLPGVDGHDVTIPPSPSHGKRKFSAAPPTPPPKPPKPPGFESASSSSNLLASGSSGAFSSYTSPVTGVSRSHEVPLPLSSPPGHTHTALPVMSSILPSLSPSYSPPGTSPSKSSGYSAATATLEDEEEQPNPTISVKAATPTSIGRGSATSTNPPAAPPPGIKTKVQDQRIAKVEDLISKANTILLNSANELPRAAPSPSPSTVRSTDPHPPTHYSDDEDDIPPPSYTPPRSFSPLGSQSRKATEELMMPSSSVQIEALTSKLQNTREQLTEQESLVAALRKEMGTAKAEATLLRSKVSEVSEKRSHDIASADKLLEDSRKDNDMLSRKKADLSHQVDQLNSKIEEVQTSLNDRIFELETECEYLRESKDSAADSQVDELEAECEMLRSDKQRALIENLNLSESTNAKINDLEKQIASLSEEKAALLSTITTQQSSMEELQVSLASAQDTTGRRTSVKFDQSSMIADLKENLEQVKKELMSAKAAAMRKESAKEMRRESEESAALKDEIDRLRGELEAAKVAKTKAMGLAMKLVGSEAFLKQLSSASDMGAISQLKAALQSKVPPSAPPTSSSSASEPTEASPPKEIRRTSSPAVIKKEVSASTVEIPKLSKTKGRTSSSSRDLSSSSSSKGASTATASVRSTATASVRSTSPSKKVMRGGARVNSAALSSVYTK